MRLMAIIGLIALITSEPARAGICDAPDNILSVSGTDHCLQIKTYQPATPNGTIVIVLHGDLSSGGSADYIFSGAEAAAARGAVGIAMMRPGYTGDGRTSSGWASRDQDRDQIYTAAEFESVGAAVAALKTHHKADRVVMIGHSGGATNAGVLLGSRPDIVDAVILISCPCDVPTWRDRRGRKPLANAQSPHDYLDKIKPSAKIYAVTGSRDTNTAPYLAKAYVAAAQARGLAAVYLEVDGAGHGFSSGLRDSQALRQALDGVLQ